MLKRMDSTRLAALGWQAHIGFSEGIAGTYRWFLNQATVRR
jgi:GDP-L-fucose synthase